PWLTLACRPALPYLREACLAGDSVWRRPGPIGRFACRGLTLLLEQARLPLSNRARSLDPLAPLGIKRFFLPTRAHAHIYMAAPNGSFHMFPGFRLGIAQKVRSGWLRKGPGLGCLNPPRRSEERRVGQGVRCP